VTHKLDHFIGRSPAAQTVRRDIELAARSDAKVLISGEGGAGKATVARLIHRHSRRHDAPFITIHCASVPDAVLESEIFGHARDSFVQAVRDQPGLLRLAHHGAVFLGEVDEMTSRIQESILRFLDTGEVHTIGGGTDVVDVRVLAATNTNMARRAAAGEFRLDLFYRLNVIRIDVPPLRDRREDVLDLVDHFFEVFARTDHSAKPVLSSEAAVALIEYDWPGNLRELRRVAERMVVRRAASPIPLLDLPQEISGISASSHQHARSRAASA
jgi:two-component system NtrC family response regulator